MREKKKPRYIDAKKAFEVIKNLLYETAINNAGVNEAVDVVCQDFADNRLATWLDEVPSVELSEEMKWVSPKERLPKKDQRVLVTIYTKRKGAQVRSGTYYEQWFYNDNGDGWKCTDKEVRAWTPLPDPYIGGGENDG